MSALQQLLNYQAGASQVSAAQISALEQLRMQSNMNHATRRAEAQVDCYMSGEYEPPNPPDDDMQGIYFNPLIIGDKAIAALPDGSGAVEPTARDDRPRPAPSRPLPWALLLLATALLLGLGAIAWALLNRPPTSEPYPQPYIWRFLEE